MAKHKYLIQLRYLTYEPTFIIYSNRRAYFLIHYHMSFQCFSYHYKIKKIDESETRVIFKNDVLFIKYRLCEHYYEASSSSLCTQYGSDCSSGFCMKFFESSKSKFFQLNYRN